MADSRVELHLDEATLGTWDRGRIEQIVVNLFSNAVKYAPKSVVGISVGNRNGNVFISVRDQGPGIPKEKQGMIFERFERATSSRSISGLGLGLYIVKQIVDAHHGEISVDSDTGRGATFTVTLPVHSGLLPTAGVP